MDILLEPANVNDLAGILSLRNTVGEALTENYGKGPWTSAITDSDVLMQMNFGTVHVVRLSNAITRTSTDAFIQHFSATRPDRLGSA